MKQFLALLAAGILCLSAAGCSREVPDKVLEEKTGLPAEQTEPEPVLLVQPVVTDGPELAAAWEAPGKARLSLLQTEYPAGTEIMTLVVENIGDTEIGYGLEYSCEKLVDGQWCEAGFVDNLIFADILYTAEPHSTRAMELNWSQLREPLEEGVYRVTGSGIQVGEDMTDSWQLDFRVSADAEPEPDYALVILDQPVSAAADTFRVRLFNNTGEYANVLFIPHLERLDASGVWQEVPYKDNVGFCGMADPLPPEGREWEENAAWLWPVLEEGRYRLSYKVGRDFETEMFAYGEFTVYMPEICELPLAED